MHSRKRSKEISAIESNSPISCPRIDRITSKKYSTVSTKRDEHFDKYYILPSLRYKHKNQNPKNNPESYQDETFIYKNMHNSNFWNWVHPLDAFKLKKENKLSTEKVNIEMLEKFRSNLQKKTDKRVPLLVE